MNSIQFKTNHLLMFCFTLVAMATKCLYQQGIRLMPIVPMKLHAKYELNMT